MVLKLACHGPNDLCLVLLTTVVQMYWAARSIVSIKLSRDSHATALSASNAEIEYSPLAEYRWLQTEIQMVKATALFIITDIAKEELDELPANNGNRNPPEITAAEAKGRADYQVFQRVMQLSFW